MSRPYIIGTPAYDPQSGGCMVIHRFCHELNEHGQEAYVSNKTTNPAWNTPYYAAARESDRVHDGQVTALNPSYSEWRDGFDVISVYPEITFGNPLGTRTVVRYLLNNAGKLSGPKQFESSDILFAFSRMFNDFNLPEERILFLPVIDVDFFKDAGLNRNKIAYYVGKGWRNDITISIREVGAEVEITKETTTNQLNLRDILQTSKVLYCYDNITGMTELARLCGCPVVIMPNGEYTKEQYNNHEFGWNGLGWGKLPEDFDSAKFRETYLQVKEQFYDKLDRFIEITQNT